MSIQTCSGGGQIAPENRHRAGAPDPRLRSAGVVAATTRAGLKRV
jgi:hypothetical protein